MSLNGGFHLNMQGKPPFSAQDTMHAGTFHHKKGFVSRFCSSGLTDLKGHNAREDKPLNNRFVTNSHKTNLIVFKK